MVLKWLNWIQNKGFGDRFLRKTRLAFILIPSMILPLIELVSLIYPEKKVAFVTFLQHSKG